MKLGETIKKKILKATEIYRHQWNHYPEHSDEWKNEPLRDTIRYMYILKVREPVKDFAQNWFGWYFNPKSNYDREIRACANLGGGSILALAAFAFFYVTYGNDHVSKTYCSITRPTSLISYKEYTRDGSGNTEVKRGRFLSSKPIKYIDMDGDNIADLTLLYRGHYKYDEIKRKDRPDYFEKKVDSVFEKDITQFEDIIAFKMKKKKEVLEDRLSVEESADDRLIIR